ncbi:MAG: 4Fe-4S dicluster domain-containing protein [Desulfobacula sp.]|uniref:4Fe-4S dicluster domain-containing protein n=1 Tax=Desulfobacula sp. TaxID=2593537 RepID=UPI0025B92674|nr:4Fe-4S dicluster domain-containing protein [Desulfobacula sp.]MCD4720256.1 4Fe-4S dicluster domain-containing protein [Desulfobacula sp.]
MFQTTLYIAIILSITGLLYQCFFFVRKNYYFKGKKWFPNGLSIKGFFLNTLFQTKLFNAGKTRWLIHFLVVSGFLYLLIIHALDDVTSLNWFGDYQSTLDPFQFLRNLAGFFVLAGCLGFLYRRLILFKIFQKRKIQYKGIFSILLILMMILSGFLLEAAKIISEPVFIEMVEDYSDIDEDTGLEDLKIYWEKHYNVIFNEALVITREKLANGKDLNEAYCMDCHSPVKSAFISNSVAGGFKKTGVWLNQYRADNFAYYAHYFLSLLILVSLPFSRFFHIFLIPVAGLEKKIKKEQLDQTPGYINTATLYACTNCGFCSDVCSVYPNFLVTGNIDILPHSKIESFKRLMNHAPDESEALFRLQSGNADCTYCHKCTDICPSGIDLQNLWNILNQKLVLKGFPDNYTFINNKSLKEWAELAPEDEKNLSAKKVTTQLADDVSSFENCVQCTICTNVCPIVEYDCADNDMTPQQIMNLLRLGKKHLTTGTRMVWNCLTCFSCQEYCPQGIKVADIMLELRNNGNVRADAIRPENLPENLPEKRIG